MKHHGSLPPNYRERVVLIANHTTVLDTLVLGTRMGYSVVGQRETGLAGYIQGMIASVFNGLEFDRATMSDRVAIVNAMREHIKQPHRVPLLLFPEGTCINGDYVVRFSKAAFDLDGSVYPVVMQYGRAMGDPHFDKKRAKNAVAHLIDVFSMWRLRANIFYLAPMDREKDESATQFGERVRAAIAKKTNSTVIDWDGKLKRKRISPDFAKQRQKCFADLLKERS